MSRIPRKLSLTLLINSVRHKLVLHKGKQETFDHIILKIIAYAYFQDFDMIVEPRYRFRGYRPDLLVLKDPPNPKSTEKVVDKWVECKHVALEKLDKLVRYLHHANIYWFHFYSKLQQTLSTRNLKKFPRLSQVVTIGVKLTTDLDQRILTQSLQYNNPVWDIHKSDSAITVVTMDRKVDITLNIITNEINQ